MESAAFKEVMEKAHPAFTMPSRNYLCTKLLPERYSIIHDNIKLKLQEAPAACLTMDLSSSKDMRSFIGLTGHFILNFTLMSVLLTCRRFHGLHTRESIYQCYNQIVTESEVANKSQELLLIVLPTW